jgi:hypothetical protein
VERRKKFQTSFWRLAEAVQEERRGSKISGKKRGETRWLAGYASKLAITLDQEAKRQGVVMSLPDWRGSLKSEIL